MRGSGLFLMGTAQSHAPDLSKRAQGHTGKNRQDKVLLRSRCAGTNLRTNVCALSDPKLGRRPDRTAFLRAVDMVKVLDGRGVEPRQYGYVIGQRAQQVLASCLVLQLWKEIV